MNWRTNIGYISLFLVFACCDTKGVVTESAAQLSGVIEVEDMQSLLGQKHVKIIDFRKAPQYVKGHIPGALNLWRSDIEDPDNSQAGIMARSDQLESLLGSLGISPKDTLIVYDDNALCDAARLWWVLQNYQHEQVLLLNGGYTAWRAKGGEISTQAPQVVKTKYQFGRSGALQKYYIAHQQMVKAVAQKTVVLDARSPDEYSGKRLKNGATRAGRIPGSINFEWTHTVHYKGNKQFKSLEEIETLLADLNLDKNEPLIVYCHSGVRSAHLTFVLTELLGYKNVRNYDGSWIQWSAATTLPIESDY